MALLTAEDVLNKAFSKTKYREGFDQDEVDDFLDDIAHTISSLTAERDDLATRLQAALAGQASQPAADAPGGPYGTQATPAAPQPAPAPEPVQAAEPSPAFGTPVAAIADATQSPTGMLAMAQKLHDEYVNAAEVEKERIVSEAQAEADRILTEAQTEAQTRMDDLVRERGELERKIDDLRRFERDYRGRLTTYLENLLGDLDHGAGKDRAPGDAHTP